MQSGHFVILKGTCDTICSLDYTIATLTIGNFTVVNMRFRWRKGLFPVLPILPRENLPRQIFMEQ